MKEGEGEEGAREGVCTGDATMLQPSTLRLICNAAALSAESPTLESNNSVQVNGSHLVFVMPAESEHLYKLLVYSFLGRILHEEQSNSANSADYNTNKWMMFDSNTRTFHFQQSMCDFNKTIYTTLVLASISLLMFLSECRW